jgi:folate-binding protein YgfZ
MIELNGRRLGLDDELARDYGAFHESAAAIDLSDRGRMRFTGKGARDALNGVLTCDLTSVTTGQGTYGVALTSKGKVVADLFVFAFDDSFLIECPPAAWPGWQALVAKYINPRLAPRTDESATTGAIGVFGPDAARITGAVTNLSSAALEALPMCGHLPTDAGNVARIPDMGVDGFRIMVARAEVAAVRHAMIEAGARGASPTAVECARIEAGWPVWGVDMDESTLPQEANLEAIGAISYTKGCYTGQEVVARLHFRGHVNKRLMGLRIGGTAAPERGAEVTTIDGTACGNVRSSVVSPRFGPIALAMIRREVDAGTAVRTRVGGIEVEAEVSSLPFGG